MGIGENEKCIFYFTEKNPKLTFWPTQYFLEVNWSNICTAGENIVKIGPARNYVGYPFRSSYFPSVEGDWQLTGR